MLWWSEGFRGIGTHEAESLSDSYKSDRYYSSSVVPSFQSDSLMISGAYVMWNLTITKFEIENYAFVPQITYAKSLEPQIENIIVNKNESIIIQSEKIHMVPFEGPVINNLSNSHVSRQF